MSPLCASRGWQPALALWASIAWMGCGGAGDLPRGAGALELGQLHEKIIGGALDEDTSGVVGLALDLGQGRIAGHCSGTLIAPNLVLTARHCVAFTDEADEQGVVRCDTALFNDTLPAHRLLASPNPVRPKSEEDPSYVRGREIRTLGDAGVCGFDIALIILEGNGITDASTPIVPRLSLAPIDAELFSTVGFGLTDPDDPGSDGTRQRADGSAVRCAREDCVTLSDGAIRSSEWASVNAPICSGDSGGPALDERGRVFGVASRGDLDCEIAVYGDVSSWGPFILDTALDAAALGGYEPSGWALGQEPDEINAGASVAAVSSSSGGESAGCSLGRPAPPVRSGWVAALAPAVVGCLAWLTRRQRRALSS